MEFSVGKEGRKEKSNLCEKKVQLNLVNHAILKVGRTYLPNFLIISLEPLHAPRQHTISDRKEARVVRHYIGQVQ